MAFAPDGRTLATAGADGAVGLWDVATGAQPVRLQGFPAIVLHVAFEPGGRTLLTVSAGGIATDGEVRRWNLGLAP